MSQRQLQSDRQGSSASRTPRWVVVTGVILILAVVLVSIILATGLGGPHGPGRHEPSGAAPREIAAEAVNQLAAGPAAQDSLTAPWL